MCQIDILEGTENLAALRAGVFLLFKKNYGGGGQIASPQLGEGYICIAYHLFLTLRLAISRFMEVTKKLTIIQRKQNNFHNYEFIAVPVDSFANWRRTST